ncbi:MAG: hypothetical protein CMJ20_12445 [Phycisphaeraceae bacterium]|nr:hypothetical protein [Phycisphaeraceae bacterium]
MISIGTECLGVTDVVQALRNDANLVAIGHLMISDHNLLNAFVNQFRAKILRQLPTTTSGS